MPWRSLRLAASRRGIFSFAARRDGNAMSIELRVGHDGAMRCNHMDSLRSLPRTRKVPRATIRRRGDHVASARLDPRGFTADLGSGFHPGRKPPMIYLNSGFVL